MASTTTTFLTAGVLLALISVATCYQYQGGGVGGYLGKPGGYGGATSGSGYGSSGAGGGYDANSPDKEDDYDITPIMGGLYPPVGYPMIPALYGFSWPFIYGGWGGVGGFHGAQALGRR